MRAMAKPNYDEKLWFKHLGCTGKHYVLGNPHTVPGRVWAWCPKEKCCIFVSLNDMGEMSQAAKYWMQGYLNGNEPKAPEGEYGVPDFDSKEYKRWLRKTANFRRTGKWVTDP